MKVIAVADLHLTESSLDEYRFEFIETHLQHMVVDLEADALLILGDLTEAKDKHSAVLVNRTVSAIDKLASISPVVILLGNHDYANEGQPFFAFSRHLPDVHFISKVKEGGALPGKLGKMMEDCLFLPHSRDPDRDWDGLKFDRFEYVFAHQAFKDAKTSFGHKLDGYPVDRFERTRVIAGDIHSPQQVGPVTYIGAPYTVDYGDDYKSRALLIDGDRMRDVPLHLCPQKKLINMEITHADLAAAASGVHEGDVCRIRVAVDNLNDWPEILKHIRKQANTLNLKIESISPVIWNRAKAHRIKPVSGDSKKSDAELVQQFAERERLDDATLDAGLSLVEDK